MTLNNNARRPLHARGTIAYPGAVAGLLVTVITLLITGCAEVRKVTYPPSFTYIDRSELRSTMAEFAAKLWDINELLTKPEVSERDRQQVADLLEEMERRAEKLNPKGNSTNHPAIDAHLEEFRSELWEARQAVKDDPPNYFLAGQMYGQCMACHKERDKR